MKKKLGKGRGITVNNRGVLFSQKYPEIPVEKAQAIKRALFQERNPVRAQQIANRYGLDQIQMHQMLTWLQKLGL